MSDENFCIINTTAFSNQCIQLPDLEGMRGGDEEDEEFVDPENPYNKYEVDSRNVLKNGPYQGEVLAVCRAQNGDVRVIGALFNGAKLKTLREFLNIGTSKAYFDKESLIPGVVCIEANQRPFNKWAIDALKRRCPTPKISQQECNVVAENIEEAFREETFVRQMGSIFVGFGILAPIGGAMVFGILSYVKHRATRQAASTLVSGGSPLIRVASLSEIVSVKGGRLPPLLLLVGLGIAAGFALESTLI